MSGTLVAHMDVVVKYHLCTTLTATKFSSGILNITKVCTISACYVIVIVERQSVAFNSLLRLRAMQGARGKNKINQTNTRPTRRSC